LEKVGNLGDDPVNDEGKGTVAGLAAGFRIGDFEVRPMEGVVAGPHGEARIEPKAMAVLMELGRHAGEVCSREQIQQVVWPRGYTTDDVLTRCVGQIRKAFGDDPRNPAYVETLPKRGYRLAKPVEADGASGPRPEAGGETASDKLIVLPFLYLASDGHDYIADGITELLTARLARLQGVIVISRTTAMHFRGSRETVSAVRARTGARWVIEGSVLQSGDRVQAVVQLIDTRSDAHVWAEDYTRDISDILVLQNDIAHEIAAAIRVRLGVAGSAAAVPTVMPADAMRDYLRGRQLLSIRSVDSLRRAVSRFTRVCEAVPDYGPAFASRAEANFMLAHYGAESPDTVFGRCTADVEHALSLNPDQANALSCRGVLSFGFERDMAGAERDLLRALQQLPGYSIAMLTLGNVCAVQGRFDEARKWLRQALLVDPLDVGIAMNVGDHLILQGRYAEAVAAFDEAIDLAPDHRPSQLRRCWALALAGQAAEALLALDRIGPAGGDDWQWLEYAALVAGAGRDRAAARRHYRALENVAKSAFVSPWSLARAASAAGEVDAGLRWLELARDQRSTSFPFAAVTPALDPLRTSPAFAEIVSPATA
jgi:TolB-like protein/Tfp pilus assembly protein PilF